MTNRQIAPMQAMPLSQINLFCQRLVPAFLLAVVLLLSQSVSAQAPTQQTVYNVLKTIWEKPAPAGSDGRTTLTVNSARFGQAYRATAQEVQVDGFPAGGTVTPALIDFTVRTYYNTETQVLRRVREAKVYKDKFGDWAVQTGSVKGQDITTTEPIRK